MKKSVLTWLSAFGAVLALPCLNQGSAYAATPPTASVVPFVSSNPTSPHTSWSGNTVILKGAFTSPNLGTDTFTWDWNPGDGGSHCTGTIDTSYTLSGLTDNPYVLSCQHIYTGTIGTLFTAVLTVTDTTNSTVAPASNCPLSITQGACYYTSLNSPPPNLSVEVNNAIDNGLWILHSRMNRHTVTNGGNNANLGDWYGGVASGTNVDSSGAGGNGVDSSNCAAFENSGFLQNATPTNPYADDVARCLNTTFNNLYVNNISTVTLGDGSGTTYNPDSNGNGIGVGHNGYPENYQTGMMLDAIVAAGTPTLAIPAGTALYAANPAVPASETGHPYSYKDAIFDMVDQYSYCMNLGDTFGTVAGGWHYSCQESVGDNSVSQWAAIGIIPARRKVGLPLGFDPLSSVVMSTDQAWLNSSFTANSSFNGYFGYTSNSPIWGPYADTPSGLVQLAMNGLGRGTTVSGNHLWDSAETYLRDNFGGTGTDPTWDYPYLKSYFYGMYSFTKSMLLHDNNDTGEPAPGLNTIPITLLQSSDDPNTCKLPVPEYMTTPGDSGPGTGSSACYPPIDWYGAQTSTYGGSDPTDGVARTLVNAQDLTPGDTNFGSWYGHNASSSQYYLETGIAITMLNKTVFQPVPVACFTANPAAVASGGPVTLNGGCSVDQNPSNTLVSWWWDVDGTGGTNFTIKPGSPQCLDLSCSIIKYHFTLPNGASLPYSYPVRLRVIDSANLTADVVGHVTIASPPNPPNANAGGPYNFCPNTNVQGGLIYTPWILNGANSTNPDQGQTDGTPGAPPSTIVSYLWDFSCSGSFSSASGAQVNVTSAFDIPADFGASFNVCLQVTNNDNLAFPTAGLSAGLSSVASAQVTIHQPTDEFCTHCVQTLRGVPKAATPGVPANIQIYWTDTNTSSQFTINHYNIYRSTSPTFVPAVQIAGAGSASGAPGVPVANPAGSTVVFIDNYQVTTGTTYYYRIAPATVNDTETCQSNQTLGVTVPRTGR